MKQNVFRFCLSAFLFWFAATFAVQVLNIPEKIFNIAAFVPPVLGLMWGIPAALGVYVGGLLFLPELKNFSSTGGILFFVRTGWIFLAAYLPFVLWKKIVFQPEKKDLALGVHTLQKFLLIMFVTFFATSLFRSLTATPAELEFAADAVGSAKPSAYMFACLLNDFCVAIFFDLAWFFFLVSRNYAFAVGNSPPEKSSTEIHRAWLIALGFYALFPVAVFYLDKFQIYGMARLETWLTFITECLSLIDLYLILMLYLLLRYRRSIMMEVVFLVALTVFFSASVLGWGASVAMTKSANARADESLRAMSVICRERLYRTFFCVRQAVIGMKFQALDSLESYNRLANDAAYRTQYLAEMKRNFNSIALRTDGSISYYLRFKPEIAGTKGGFSMQREDARWEGALSPFVEREPIDLAPYAPDDDQKVGWFYIPFKSNSAVWIDPYEDAVTNFYVISYVAPLFVDGQFLGVVGMDIDFNFIIQELRRMSIYDYGYVYIMDRNNRVLYHRDQPQGALFQPNPEFREIELYLTNGMWLGIATPLSKIFDERNRILMHLVAAIIVVAMIISVLSISLASKAVRPLSGMTEAAKRIASGDLNVKISYESGNELGILVRSIREMAAKLEVYMYRDKLTGLRNAASYMSKSNDLDAQNKLVNDLAYGVVVFDANFLKKVNDNYGHNAGNELLRHAAIAIRKVFKNSPVYRVGGDEFAAILEGEDFANREELLTLFDEVAAQEQFEAGGDILTVSVARGLGVHEPGMEFAAVAKKADAAMYNHKAAIKAKYGEDVR